MIERILTVGGFTLLSRLTGFLRDIMLAAILGAGPVADAFFVAFRLPKSLPRHLRRRRIQRRLHSRLRAHSHPGRTSAAGLFGDRIFTLLIATQAVLLALALLFTPQVIELLAPGFSREPQRFALRSSLTRITFPYLLLITLVTLWGGILNALHRFAAAAAAPILLNLSMMATLALVTSFGGAGLRGGVGRADIRRAASRAGRRRHAARRRLDFVSRAALRRRCAPVLQGAHSGDDRLGRHAARAVRRYHHRQLPGGGRDLGAVLRRPHRPAADRRHRHCRRHGAVAGDDAPDRGRR